MVLTWFVSSTDLAEVQSVASASPVQVGTKKIDERAFFDVSVLLSLFTITILILMLLKRINNNNYLFIFFLFPFSWKPVVEHTISMQLMRAAHKSGLKRFKPVYNSISLSSAVYHSKYFETRKQNKKQTVSNKVIVMQPLFAILFFSFWLLTHTLSLIIVEFFCFAQTLYSFETKKKHWKNQYEHTHTQTQESKNTYWFQCI